jgi:hypothetical protein
MVRTELTSRILQASAFLFIFFVFLFLLWNMAYGIWAGFLLLIPFMYCIKKIWDMQWRPFLKIVLVSVVAYLVFLPIHLLQYDAKSRRMMATIHAGDQLDFIDKGAIYGLNLIIGLGALPFYPEVGIETLLMCVPDEDRVRTFQGDFFLASKQIQRVPVPSHNKTVSWHPEVYAAMTAESRAALALNKCLVRVKKKADSLYYEAEVEISYPPNSRALLTPRPFAIPLEEGLFHYLEKCGWLYPYTAIWKAQVPVARYQ